MITTAAQLIERDIAGLRPYGRNARTHSKKQLKQIAASIERFGFTNPVLVSDEGEIIAGHGRVEAAKLLGWKRVPTIALSHLSDIERRAYVLADNKLALNAGWDREILAIELQELVDLEFDVELTGFSLAEIDFVLDEAGDADPDGADEPEDAVPVIEEDAVSRRGDIWQLGRHKLLCGDARSADDHALLLGGERVDLVFTDPPYNVKIDGNVCGLGSVRHREFAFASGEMSESQFTAFLAVTLGNAASHMRDGAIAFVCMDWRHMGELLAAGSQVFTELKNLVVWNKTNGGMGAFYRSKHELVFVFKQGCAEHTNSFGLGETGRYRTNVWDYAGISSIGSSRADDLAMHPTVKPVALIADALRDCSRRGEIVFDGFGGSGSTMIAAEKTGRIARLIECDPLYCDTIIRRWEKVTGKRAILAACGIAFEEVAEDRFKKGQSGNPRGRPRGSKNSPKVSMEFGLQPATELLRQEAYRPVAVREGEQVIEMPAIQAVFRSMGVSAMKGNRFAQRTLTEMMRSIEAEDFRLRMEQFGTAIDYKLAWEQEIERCRAAGRPLPEPIPHPDDIILDPNTGGVKIQGPKTKEQKEHYDLSIARRDLAQADVTCYANKYRKARNTEIKAWYLTEWKFEQRIFDTINDLLGKRYQVELKDRCYQQGASRKGDDVDT